MTETEAPCQESDPIQARSGGEESGEADGDRSGHGSEPHRLEGVVGALCNFVVICAPDGTLLEANGTGMQSELEPFMAASRKIWDASWWLHDDQVERQLRAAVDGAAEGNSSRFDATVQSEAGGLIPVDLRIVPVIEGDAVVAVAVAGIDISDRIIEHDRLEALANLSHHLNAARHTSEVTELVVEHAHQVLGASFADVALMDEDQSNLRIFMPARSADIRQRWSVLPLQGNATPLHEALTTRRPVYVDRVERARRFPATLADFDRLGLDSSAAVPLIGNAGDVVGVLGVSWSESVRFGIGLRARLRLLAELCAQAFERTRRGQAQDHLIQELQAELLAGHEDFPGLDIALGYAPAQTEIGFGGDWYDVIVIDEHRVALVVGDVAGHGIAAAARMTATKAKIRALVLTTPSRADVIPKTTAVLSHLRSGYVATVALAWIDTETDQLEWRLAGHLPPILRTPDGACLLLGGAHHPPLGMPTTAREVPPIGFPPGSLLVLYTDGLIERRGENIDESLAGLRASVESLPADLTAGEVRARLMNQYAGPDATDDVAIVVVNYPQAGAVPLSG